MKKIISTLAIFICALIPAVMFTSCLDNDDEGKNQILTSNFVTYEGMRGGKPVFTYVNTKTQATVTLTGDLTDLKNVNEGDRCFLTNNLPETVLPVLTSICVQCMSTAIISICSLLPISAISLNSKSPTCPNPSRPAQPRSILFSMPRPMMPHATSMCPHRSTSLQSGIILM